MNNFEYGNGGGTQDEAQAQAWALLRASCASGEPAGCGRLGRAMALHGSQQGHDHEEQMAAFRRGCDLHDEDACVGWRQFTSVTP